MLPSIDGPFNGPAILVAAMELIGAFVSVIYNIAPVPREEERSLWKQCLQDMDIYHLMFLSQTRKRNKLRPNRMSSMRPAVKHEK